MLRLHLSFTQEWAIKSKVAIFLRLRKDIFNHNVVSLESRGIYLVYDTKKFILERFVKV